MRVDCFLNQQIEVQCNALRDVAPRRQSAESAVIAIPDVCLERGQVFVDRSISSMSFMQNSQQPLQWGCLQNITSGFDVLSLQG